MKKNAKGAYPNNNLPQFHLKSFRQFIEELEKIGEVQEITQTVDWNLEMGAVGRLCYEKGAPVPLFTKITGIEKGFRAATALGGVSNQAGLYLSRIALSLGLPAETTGKEIVEFIANAREREYIKPVEINATDAPCKQNIITGDSIDLLKFPVPLIHDGDGGRYINTFGIIVAQTPDKKWTNWSIARIMLTDKTNMTGIIAPNQHIGMIYKMWKDSGKDMPYALVLGGEPAIPFVGGMPLPAWVDEADFLGAYFGEGIEVTKAETVDLMVPATAEIVIEGHVSIRDTAPEGPMGEYAGYAWGGEGTPKPVYHVTAITHRDNPILPFTVAGEPVEEDHTAWGIPNAGEIIALLRKDGIPVTSAWLTLEAANHWGVITLPNNWKTHLNISCDELIQKIASVLFDSKAGMGTPKFIVINDDIDPTNTNEVVWGFATRCHPGSGEVVFLKQNTNPLVAFLTSDEKMSFKTTKVIYNCLAPDSWGDTLPRRVNFKRSWPQEVQDKVLRNWKKYGFAE